MKVSDYIASVVGQFCPFIVQGGAAVHMVDSLARGGYRYVCTAHEQAAGFAADGYAKVKGLGVVVTTCGPGATNLLTAAASAYFENVPVLYLVGQQHGFQELNLVGMFKSVTGYAEMVVDPSRMENTLKAALYIAHAESRPVLLNIHDDVYRAQIDAKPELYEFDWRKAVGKHRVDSHTKQIFAKERSKPPEDSASTGFVNPYYFMQELNRVNGGNPFRTVVTDIGNHGVWCKQASNRPVISDNNFGSMGYAIAASMGVACAGEKVVCINGDGGIQMNIQELATIAKHEMDIKIFILNDAGYGMIRCTQDRWLESRHFGCDLFDLPRVDFERVATAYGIPNRRWETHEDVDFDSIFSMDGPMLVNVSVDPKQGIYESQG